MYIAKNLATEDEKKFIYEIFKLMDKNLDGKISKQEVDISIAERENEIRLDGRVLTNDEKKKILDNMDYDNDGSIEYAEFVAHLLPSKTYTKDNYLS